MDYKSQGLTVGELTIAVGTLIILGLIWTNLGKKEASKTSSILLEPSHSLTTHPS